jgi:hypothetical protein
MSTPLPPRRPGPPAANATRQLLDELDALMERMLALPVNDLGDTLEHETTAPADALEAPSVAATTAFPQPAVESSPPRAALSEMLPGLTKESTNATDGRPLGPHPPFPEPPAPHGQLDQRPGLEPPVTAGPPAFSPTGLWPLPSVVCSDAAPFPAGPETAPARQPVPGLPCHTAANRRVMPAAPRLAGWWGRSLVWSNRTFDRWTCRLGRPGRWLQGTTGRTLLGWLGISLLCAAAVWGLSTWFDWTW